MASIMHIADLHLDRPFKGFSHLPQDVLEKLHKSTYESLKKLVDTAIEKEVDAFLIAGDVFDNEMKSVKAIHFLHTMFARLHEANVAIVLCFGNHDGFYVQHATVPDYVHVLPKEVETVVLYTKSGIPLHIHGFSYHTPHVKEDMVVEYPLREGEGIHIGMLHGQEKGQEKDNNYAPFTVSSLLEKQYDYWALGHIHQRKVLSSRPYVQYAGSIQGANRKEVGRKGGMLVNFTSNETIVSFIPTNTVEWKAIHVDGTGVTSFSPLISLLQNAIESDNQEVDFSLLTLHITLDEGVHDLFGKPLQEHVVWEWFSESFTGLEQGYFVEKVLFVKKTRSDFSSPLHQAVTDYVGNMTDEELYTIVKDTYYHPPLYPLLSESSDPNELKNEAVTLLFELLEEVKMGR